MKHLLTTLTALAAAILLTTAVPAQDAHDHEHHGHDHAAASDAAPLAEGERIGDAWPLDTCVVAAGSKLGSMGDPIIMLHEGREVRFCCAGCIDAFEADPDRFLARADRAITEQQKAAYPLTHCVVDTDEELAEEMSHNFTAVIGNRLFAFCCPGCVREAKDNPKPYFEALDKAVIEAQKADYPLDTCVVADLPLDSMGGPYDIVHAGQLVRFCCAGCLPRFEADPAAHLKKIEDARDAANDASGAEAAHH